MLLKHTNDILNLSVARPFENIRSYTKGSPFSGSSLNTSRIFCDELLQIKEKGSKSLNTYIYIAVKKTQINLFSRKCYKHQN